MAPRAPHRSERHRTLDRHDLPSATRHGSSSTRRPGPVGHSQASGTRSGFTVTVDGITNTTTADANGNYTLPITTANLNQLLKIEAAGTSETGTPIEFTNLIGSFSRVLDEQTSTGTAKGNVTNVTTASYVLVLQANDGQEPATEEQLRSAETAVDATKLLQLAAIIKLIVDEGYDLPPGETNLIDFISDPEAVAQYVETTLSTPAGPGGPRHGSRRDPGRLEPRRRFLGTGHSGALLRDPRRQPGLHGAQRLHPGVRCRFGRHWANARFLLRARPDDQRAVHVADRERSPAGRFAQTPIEFNYVDVADSPALAGVLTPAEQAALRRRAAERRAARRMATRSPD